QRRRRKRGPGGFDPRVAAGFIGGKGLRRGLVRAGGTGLGDGGLDAFHDAYSMKPGKTRSISGSRPSFTARTSSGITKAWTSQASSGSPNSTAPVTAQVLI